MGVEGIGARGLRKEDKRFITGKGKYTDDFKIAEMNFAAFVSNGYLIMQPDVHFNLRTSHSDMLDCALETVPCMYDDERFMKRELPRKSPWNHVFKELHRIYWDDWKTERWVGTQGW